VFETQRCILVADDNNDALESLATLLQLSGHEVYTAANGVIALESAEPVGQRDAEARCLRGGAADPGPALGAGFGSQALTGDGERPRATGGRAMPRLLDQFVFVRVVNSTLLSTTVTSYCSPPNR
jgi:CheY-like chemotaxis protein